MTADPVFGAVLQAVFRKFPTVYADLLGKNPQQVNSVLLREFGVILPWSIETEDDVAQAHVALSVIEATDRPRSS